MAKKKRYFSRILNIRLNPKTDKALFDYAHKMGMKRSNLIREVLDNFEVVHSLLKNYQLDQQFNQQAKLDGDATNLFLSKFPDVPADIFEQVAQVVMRAAKIRQKEAVGK